MRSRLGIIGRLAAHITALVLLVVVLFQALPFGTDAGPAVSPPTISVVPSVPVASVALSAPPAESAPPPAQPTVPVIVLPVPEPPVEPVVAESVPVIVLPSVEPATLEAPVEPAPEFESAPPAEDHVPLLNGDIEIIDTPVEPGTEPEDMPPLLGSEAYDFNSEVESEIESETESAVEVAEAILLDAAAVPDEPAETETKVEDETAPETGIGADADASVITELSPAKSAPPAEPEGEPVEERETVPPPTPGEPAVRQPDESGSLVVAESETGADQPVAALAPLDNADLEVLGEDVYWLDAGPDLEAELDGLSETAVLAVLTPKRELPLLLLLHPRTVIFPAEPDDLSPDAAEHFIAVTSGADAPVVAVNLPDAMGGAFFKGAYLLVRRNLDIADALAEIEPELKLAGDSRDEIIHRLRRLDVDDLRRRYAELAAP